jgi:hypothetical protein
MIRTRIIIESAEPHEMRPPYNEPPMAGDWQWTPDGTLLVKVSGDVLSPEGFLFGLHEMIEAYLCKHRGIPQEAVDGFDARFAGDGEPGDHPNAPYRAEHRFAMLIEHLTAHELGVAGYGVVT